MNANSTTTGTTATREAANRYCHCTWYSPMKLVMPTVSGCVSASVVNVKATMNSFHAAMNVKITAVITPGTANGSVTLANAAKRPQPSSSAASSSSTGIEEK